MTTGSGNGGGARGGKAATVARPRPRWRTTRNKMLAFARRNYVISNIVLFAAILVALHLARDLALAILARPGA